MGNSRITDRDFRCFYMYPCEVFLSHIPVPALGKDKSRTDARWPYVGPWRQCNVKMTLPCRISAYSGFSRQLFQVFFQYKWGTCIKWWARIHYSCEDGIEKSVPRDHRLSLLGKLRDANRWSSGRIFLSQPHTHDRFLYSIRCIAFETLWLEVKQVKERKYNAQSTTFANQLTTSFSDPAHFISFIGWPTSSRQ